MKGFIKTILRVLGVLPRTQKIVQASSSPSYSQAISDMIIRRQREQIALIVLQIQSFGMEWCEKEQLWRAIVEQVNLIPTKRVGQAFELAEKAKEAYSNLKAGEFSRFNSLMEQLQTAA